MIRVVLPLPRNPVTIVTGVFKWLSFANRLAFSAILRRLITSIHHAKLFARKKLKSNVAITPAENVR